MKLKLLLIIFAIFAVFFLANYFIFAIAYTFKLMLILLGVGLVGYFIGRFSHSKN